MKHTALIGIFLALVACTPSSNQGEVEAARTAILEAEANFNQMAQEAGLTEAFVTFAADSAVLNRRGVVKGKLAIREFYENRPYVNASLTWKPDFVDVAASGDLGYTYGKYTYITVDSLGNRRETNGIFHTVWKKQADGSWKYVYD